MLPVLPSRWVIASGDTVDDADIFPFLAGQSFLLRKSPVWSSKKDLSISGRERARTLWSYPIWRFSLAHEFLRDAADLLELQRLVTFFNSKMGGAVAFFYLDRDDHSVTNCQIGVGDGGTTTFQAMRTTTIGGIAFSEPVRGFYGTPQVYVNGLLQPDANVTVGALGAITLSGASIPGAGQTVAWTGNYFHLCRFDADEIDVSQVLKGIWANGALDFRSFKP